LLGRWWSRALAGGEAGPGATRCEHVPDGARHPCLATVAPGPAPPPVQSLGTAPGARDTERGWRPPPPVAQPGVGPAPAPRCAARRRPGTRPPLLARSPGSARGRAPGRHRGPDRERGPAPAPRCAARRRSGTRPPLLARSPGSARGRAPGSHRAPGTRCRARRYGAWCQAGATHECVLLGATRACSAARGDPARDGAGSRTLPGTRPVGHNRIFAIERAEGGAGPLVLRITQQADRNRPRAVTDGGPRLRASRRRTGRARDETCSRAT